MLLSLSATAAHYYPTTLSLPDFCFKFQTTKTILENLIQKGKALDYGLQRTA